MALDLMEDKGVPLEKQLLSFTWRDMVRTPVSKLDDDAFTKVRIILMNGIEPSNYVQASLWARERRSAPAAGAGAKG